MGELADTGNEAIIAEIDGPVGRLTIARPDRHNALDTAMWRAIPQAVGGLEAASNVRVILVRGAGDRAFSAGADISEFDTVRATADTSRAYDALNEAAFSALRNSPLPSVALIHGICFGGGLALAAACDLRIGAQTSLYAIPAARLGLAYPHDSLAHLVRLIGPAAAKQLLFTAARLDARQAYIMGLLSDVVEDGNLDAHGETLCAQIAANAPLTIRAAKFVIEQAAQNPSVVDMGKISALADICFDSQDYAEGRRAFKEKRQPVFRGE